MNQFRVGLKGVESNLAGVRRRLREVTKELNQGVGDEGRIEKSCFAERGSSREIGLYNNGNNREQGRVSSESKGNSTELRGKREPGNRTVKEKAMAASADGWTCGGEKRT